VFYLMMPLGKAMRLRTGKDYLLYVLTIVAGGTMAHSLVPPTPGPLFVAEHLQVNLATMILLGCLVGVCASAAGYWFACWVNRRSELPLRESPDFSAADMRAAEQLDERQLPPFSLSLLPIVFPVLLITARTVLDSSSESTADGGWGLTSLISLAHTLGDKNVALMLAAGIALATLAWQKRSTPKDLAAAVQTALAGGGIIILITSAGGAFGGAVRQCGIAEEIARLTGDVPPLLILPIAFLITTMIRTAQGSATVAMMTAVSVLGHFAEPGGLDFHPVYLALAIGCGSKPIAWMNDSGFWVICKMSGMTEAEGLRTVTPMTALMGLSGLMATMTLAWIMPLT
jgi:GntP family gluconate:H+ symporter